MMQSSHRAHISQNDDGSPTIILFGPFPDGGFPRALLINCAAAAATNRLYVHAHRQLPRAATEAAVRGGRKLVTNGAGGDGGFALLSDQQIRFPLAGMLDADERWVSVMMVATSLADFNIFIEY